MPGRGLPTFHTCLPRGCLTSTILHDETIVVTRCGRICLGRKKINFITVFAGQAVGIKQVHDDIWLASLWIMIWDNSISRLGNRSKSRSVQKCLPMS